MNTHEYYLQKALDIAVESAQKGTGPFGCVIVKDDQIIARGHNQVTELNDPTAHAEIQAIRHACQKLNDFQLTDCIVYASCMPCPQCFGALYWARPKAVYYANTATEAQLIGFDDQFIYDEIEKKESDRMYPFIHLHVSDSLRAFDVWESNPHKTQY